MKEIKNIFSSILCVIRIKPSYLLVKIFSIIISVITALIPVMVVKEIVNIYHSNKNIGSIAIFLSTKVTLIMPYFSKNACIQCKHRGGMCVNFILLFCAKIAEFCITTK